MILLTSEEFRKKYNIDSNGLYMLRKGNKINRNAEGLYEELELKDIDDNKVLQYSIKNGKVSHKAISEQSLQYRPAIKEYCKNRYSDIPEDKFSIGEVIYRIFNKIENRPICPICGNPVNYINFNKGYHQFCSIKCSNNCHSINTGISREEDCLFEILSNICSSVGYTVKRQWLDGYYNWICDFYIPELKIYIEYQGSHFHGLTPFMNTSDDLKILEEYSKNDYMKKAAKTWGKTDPEKRKFADDNNLNLIRLWKSWCPEWMKLIHARTTDTISKNLFVIRDKLTEILNKRTGDFY